MATDLVNTIFGMKLRQARAEAEMTLTEFASRCGLSPSYVTEIEKGSKYPRVDKILRMADVLDREYDDLVSIRLEPSLAYLEAALSSSVFQQFPFDEFGLDPGDVVRLLTREPARASALLHAMLSIGRQYDVRADHFWLAALRSYQEIHENYFEEVESEAAAFVQQHELDKEFPVTEAALRSILQREFDYEFEATRIASDPQLSVYRSIYVDAVKPRLFVNSLLRPRQIKFLLARELGYRVLGLRARSRTSPPDQINSFQQVLNDFLASYFGGVLLMPHAALIEDIQALFDLERWNPDALLNMLTRYEVTPEMLLYRFSELIPEHFGIRLHFLRFHDTNGVYRLYKQLHLNNLKLPSGIGLHEHHCRRWLSVRLLRDLESARSAGTDANTIRVGVQKSEFIQSQEVFLCFGFARALVLNPDVRSSVMVGFQLTSTLRNVIRFTNDSAIPHIMINETCERCALTDDQCLDRGAPPTVLHQLNAHHDRRRTVQQLMAELQS